MRNCSIKPLPGQMGVAFLPVEDILAMVSNENTGVGELITVGKVALERGWYDQARDYFEQALDLAPSNREALDGLVQAILSDRTITTVEPIQDGPVEPLHRVERKPKSPHHQESENESEIRGVSLLPVAEMLDQSSPPIDALNLSIRSYYCLQRSGQHTVAQVAALSDEGLLAIPHLDPKALADIREKLAAYLAEHPLSDEAKESPPEPEPQAVEPLPLQPPAPPPHLTSLSDVTEQRVTILTDRKLERSHVVDAPEPEGVAVQCPLCQGNVVGSLANAYREAERDYYCPPCDTLWREVDEFDGFSPDGSPTKVNVPITQRVDVPTTNIHVSSQDPIQVLDLGPRLLGVLRGASIHTVGELVQRIETGRLVYVRNIGPKSMARIRDSLARVRLVDAPEAILGPKALAEDSVTEAEPYAVESPPQLPPYPPPVSISPDVLGLSFRSYTALVLANITTIEQLSGMSDEQIKDVRNIGPESLAEIKGWLKACRAAHPLTTELASSQKKPESSLPTKPGSLTHEVKPVLHPLAESKISPMQAALSSSSSQTPLKTLSLSFHTYNILVNAGITTVEQLATMSLSEILSVPKIGYDRLAKIKRKLKAYLAEHPLPDEAQQSPPELEAQMVEPPPLQLPSSPLNLTPLDALRLSIRPYNALMRIDITTVEQLARMSDEEITDVYQIGPKSLAEIREKLQVYLSANPTLATKLSKASARGALPSGTPLPDSASTQAMATTTQTVDIPTIRIRVSSEDSIEVLGLSELSFSALMHTSIRTIGELLQVVESGNLREVCGIKPDPVVEIEDSLTRVQFVDAARAIVEVPTITIEVVNWQARLIEKQISADLLHKEARIAGNSIAYWLSAKDNIIDRHYVYETMASILGDSINICEELIFLLDQVRRKDHITVLLSRYGFESKTLEELGLEIGVTRERVRQIAVTLKSKIGAGVRSVVKAQSVKDLAVRPPLLRMQSALLTAKDMGLDITYEQWERSIRSSGLVGSWTSKAYMAIDPVETLVAVCNLLADGKIQELRIPNNLNYAIELATSGTPDLPARILHIRKTLPRKTSKFIKKHAQFSGSVHARWLSQEIEEDMSVVEDVLRTLGYTEASKDWFIRSIGSAKDKIGYHDSFHHALRKMSQYCGALSIEDICSGIRYNASRTEFPIPPPNVMEQILQIHGYSSEGGLYYWGGETDEELNRAESVIMNCLVQNGPVVHHAELAQAFIDSELTLASLHPTLQRSPLFERIETSLYKLRGRSVMRQDIERAEAAKERIPVNPEVEYDKRGDITVSATLSVIAVGTGGIFSDQFPNLSGEWDCLVSGRRSGKLYATENEFRRLKRPFEFLGCKAGDRLRFTFNTWDRTVMIEKVGE